MASGAKRGPNWWLVVSGLLLALCGVAIFVTPGFFLEFLTVWAGAGFLISGIAGIGSYIQLHKIHQGAVWGLFMGVLDIVVGIMLIAYPFAFSQAIPWVLGAVFIAFGIAQVVGIVTSGVLVPEMRIISMISGILCALVGVMFIVWPSSLSIWIAALALVRGITLVAMGFTAKSY